MKKIIAIFVAMVGLGAAAPAFAQHINPAGATVSMTGPASLNGQPCTLTIGVVVNASGTGGTTTAGSNTGSGICPLITIDAGATVSPVSWNATTGVLTATATGVNVRISGGLVCTGSITLTVKNSPPPPATPTGSTVTISGALGVCTVTATLPSSLTGSM